MSGDTKANNFRYVQPQRDDKGRLIAKGTLKHGVTIGGTEKHRDFVMREALASDLFDAEKDVTADKPTTFSAAVIVRQLVSIGTFTGPFTLGIISALKARDFAELREAQAELDLAGELQ